jgi:hypothetical protein
MCIWKLEYVLGTCFWKFGYVFLEIWVWVSGYLGTDFWISGFCRVADWPAGGGAAARFWKLGLFSGNSGTSSGNSGTVLEIRVPFWKFEYRYGNFSVFPGNKKIPAK